MQLTLKAARVNAGLTQAQMAEKLHMDRGTYMKIEKDVGRATINQIHRVSEITGVEVTSFILPMKSTKVDISRSVQ